MYSDTYVYVKGIATSPDGEESITETKCAGKIKRADNRVELTFIETYGESAEKMQILNSIKLLPQSMEIKKSGAVASDMYFSANNKSDFVYRTPYGAFSFFVNCTSYSVSYGINEGCAEATYDLLNSGEKISSNTVRVSFRATPFE